MCWCEGVLRCVREGVLRCVRVRVCSDVLV